MKTIEERVRDGATFLDLNVVGWVDKIDTDLLSIASCDKCLLGQLYFDYTSAVESLCIEAYYKQHELGFAWGDYVCNDPQALVDGECGLLTSEWRKLILARRAGRNDSRMSRQGGQAPSPSLQPAAGDS